MSILAYAPTNEDEIFRHCTIECGTIISTEDQQYFALGCKSCPEKFLYFDAFMEHMQTRHATQCSGPNSVENSRKRRHDSDDEDFAEMLEPQMLIKEEKYEIDDDDAKIDNEPVFNDDDYGDSSYYGAVKNEQPDHGDSSYMGDSYGSFNDEYAGEDDENDDNDNVDNGANYDDLVEESLLDSTTTVGVTSHIKDRKMIQFLIDAYRRNTFLWDHRHPQFRDRVKRSQFIEWINAEFKKRFNLILAKDAITRKWDNLRTVYKRECNRMALEKTNVSTLWYFRELHFLNRLYGGTQKISDTVVKETVYRRRYSALWNDISTNKLLQLLKIYPCFYDKFNIDYRSKERRGDALQKMAVELAPFIEVTTIQISKRISQLRFDYSKQKQERIMCEMTGRAFTASYSYYENMVFMDSDIAPFKCEHCPMTMNSPREMDTHLMTHQHKGLSHNVSSTSASSSTNMNQNTGVTSNSSGGSNYYCPVCQLGFNDLEQFNRHKLLHPVLKEVKYHCDLCAASFREKSNYDEHMRRHNDELLIPDLDSITPDSNDEFITNDIPQYCSQTQDASGNFNCYYPNCGQQFAMRSSMMEHVKSHYTEEEFSCDVCGKAFKSVKNLQNHKQIHDAVKKYVCKICGSAFAQAAGLYLHKRRHNRSM